MANVTANKPRKVRPAGIAFLMLFLGCLSAEPVGRTAQAQTAAIQPLSANDVSWLFPAPTRVEDLDNLIAIKDLTALDPAHPDQHDPIWPNTAFQSFIAIANGPSGTVAGQPEGIGLPTAARTIDAWRVAAIRIDAGAPGLSDAIRAQFGQAPQIRLILQPVTRNADGTVQVLDTAAHLIFNFLADSGTPAVAQPGCSALLRPDLATFKQIVAELADLRTRLSQGQLGTGKVVTTGVPLGVHPGLADASTARQVRQEMQAFLQRHLRGDRLGAMAVMGLPAAKPAPWIFLSMLGVPPKVIPALPNGGFIPVHGPTLDGKQFAQMLNPAGTKPRVVPTPATNNLNPITCQSAALPAPVPPVSARKGVSTAALFTLPPPPASKITETVDVIADPTKSHFFNTDCISCHTETRLRMDLLHVTDISGIVTDNLPNGQWNVRNFGWSPPIEGPVKATVTHRTAAETDAVVAFINANLLSN